MDYLSAYSQWLIPTIGYHRHVPLIRGLSLHSFPRTAIEKCAPKPCPNHISNHLFQPDAAHPLLIRYNWYCAIRTGNQLSELMTPLLRTRWWYVCSCFISTPLCTYLPPRTISKSWATTPSFSISQSTKLQRYHSKIQTCELCLSKMGKAPLRTSILGKHLRLKSSRQRFLWRCGCPTIHEERLAHLTHGVRIADQSVWSEQDGHQSARRKIPCSSGVIDNPRSRVFRNNNPARG